MTRDEIDGELSACFNQTDWPLEEVIPDTVVRLVNKALDEAAEVAARWQSDFAVDKIKAMKIGYCIECGKPRVHTYSNICNDCHRPEE